MERLRQGIQRLQSSGIHIWLPAYAAQLAKVYSRLGMSNEGLHLLTEVLTGIRNTGESFYEAELYRLKGELLLEQTGKNQK